MWLWVSPFPWLLELIMSKENHGFPELSKGLPEGISLFLMSFQSPNMYHETNLQRGCFHLIWAYIGYVSVSCWLNHVKLPISDDKTTHFEWFFSCSPPLSLRGDGREQSGGCECCSHEVCGGAGCQQKSTTLWGYKVGRMGYQKVMGIEGRICV